MNSIVLNKSWLFESNLQNLLAILSQGKEEARIVGGAIRNSLLDLPVVDVDIATTTLPQETLSRCVSAGFKAIPTRLDHGVVTVIFPSCSYEVTTLREDIQTDGRHALVRFGCNWLCDAQRRDFTINALYAHPDGRVVDLIGGLKDLNNRVVRFIGKPEQRIAEDYVRILRFFRFFSSYGIGLPDFLALEACSRMKEGLNRLSAERLFCELKTILSAQDPRPALFWMKKTGILEKILPEIGKEYNKNLHALVKIEKDFSLKLDPFLRLMSLIPCDKVLIDGLVKRFKMARCESKKLLGWVKTKTLGSYQTEKQMQKTLYYFDYSSLLYHLKLRLALACWHRDEDCFFETDYQELLTFFNYASSWKRPVFPVTGNDFLRLGKSPGVDFGFLLKNLEKEWVASGFSLKRKELLSYASFLEKSV